MSSHFYVFVSPKDSQHYFNLKAANGEVILQSEGYVQRSGARNGVQSVRENAPFDFRYEKKTSVAYQPYFVLKASNGLTIGKSQMYSSAAARDKGIEAVKKAAPNAMLVES